MSNSIKRANLPFDVAIERVSEAIIITSTDGTIEYVNSSFERITGYLRKDVIGQNLRILEGAFHDSASSRCMWDTVHHDDVWSGHLPNKRKDGTLYEEEVRVSPIREESGQIVYYLVVIRDVTHEVKLEKKLLKAQKMETMGALASGIAHDFNNILSAIIGYTELAQLDILSNNRLQSRLTKILEACVHAKDLIRQILAFRRQTDPEKKPIQADLILTETLNFIRASIPESIEICQQFGASNSTIMADPIQIHQIVMNLCTNAAHAMEENGGTLTVGARSVILDSETIGDHCELPPGRYLKITVSDTGHGMSQDVIERLFDPFFTTKETGKGTGMGLAVVHNIVKSHKGMIKVNSKIGTGSSFHVFLPETVKNSDHRSDPPTLNVTQRL